MYSYISLFLCKDIYIFSFMYIYIYIFGTPKKSLPFFHGQRRYRIYIYIYIIFDVLEVLDFVVEGEELV